MKDLSNKSEVGKGGEKLAANFLRDLGYEIIATNWRFSYYEIDLIAKDGDQIVVVEVKTRTSDKFTAPEELVDKKKRNHLVKAAEAYIFNTDYMGELRFDLITIIFVNKEPNIIHIKDAFYPKLF